MAESRQINNSTLLWAMTFAAIFGTIASTWAFCIWPTSTVLSATNGSRGIVSTVYKVGFPSPERLIIRRLLHRVLDF